MDYGIKGKKLLFLGGAQERACAIVKRAQELGVYVIVADYNETSPTKRIADEAVLIDAMDVNSLVDYCIKNKVDGITTAYADILLKPCMEVAKRIGKPFYADEIMIKMSVDKSFFKSQCELYNVPVPKTYSVSIDDYRDIAGLLEYPVFVKPVDASGSRGAYACFNKDDFITNYESALSYSKKGQVTVEELLDGTEFIMDYILIDGRAYLLSMADRFISKGRSLAINSPNLMILPSVNLDSYVSTTHRQVCNMFRALGFNNGIVFLQGYAKNGKVVFYEMGCRLGGTWPYIDEFYTGYNPIDMLVSHAISGRMVPLNADLTAISPFFKGYAGIVYFISKYSEGIIDKIKGIENLENMPEVVSILQNNWEGDHYSVGRFTDVRFLAVHLVAPNYQILEESIEKVYSYVDFLDPEGKSLLDDIVHVDSVTKAGTFIHDLSLNA